MSTRGVPPSDLIRTDQRRRGQAGATLRSPCGEPVPTSRVRSCEPTDPDRHHSRQIRAYYRGAVRAGGARSSGSRTPTEAVRAGQRFAATGWAASCSRADAAHGVEEVAELHRHRHGVHQPAPRGSMADLPFGGIKISGVRPRTRPTHGIRGVREQEADQRRPDRRTGLINP